MRRAGWLVIATVLCSCDLFNPDLEKIVALELDLAQRNLIVGDTLRLTATAIDASNRPVPGATIGWVVLDTGTVGFTLDSVGGLITAIEPGSGRVQAWVEAIRSPAITVTVDTAATAVQAAAREFH
ncbi:MAG: hypothetical protein OEY63_02725 [Gemmatimonadota bacterium]|nr:hypothetical protein [Gemmatimonadota bacterium]MDH5804533.1 hypothetical protein [Gemmatimonadota bacterium]